MAKVRTNMIDTLIETMEVHRLDSIKVFPNAKGTIRSVSGSLALAEFMKYIGYNAEVVVSDPSKIKQAELVTVGVDREQFLAIAVDCKRITDIGSECYQRSNILVNIYGPIPVKGYGVVNFTSNEVSCSADIIFAEISLYCEQNEIDFPVNVAQLLYASLIGGTKRFSVNVRESTFDTAKGLIKFGADYKKANYLFEKKRPITLKCQEIILNKLQVKKEYGYAIVKKEDYIDDMVNRVKKDDFALALSSFRFVEDVKVLCLFHEIEKNQYEVKLISDVVYGVDVSNIARKSNGTGDSSFAEAIIDAKDIDKVIEDIELLLSRGVTTDINEYFEYDI